MKYIRPNIEALEAYKVETPDYEIILNANENPWDFPKELKEKLFSTLMDTPFNRYPDACFPELLTQLSNYTGVPEEGIIVGCGSDEIIGMINQSFINPDDTIVLHSPSFAMYEIWGTIMNGKIIKIMDDADGVPSIDKIIANANQSKAKLIYLCNPNNPTGYLFSEEGIVRILNETSALVILDEAYIEFSPENSLVKLISNYDNLLILRTLSKAFGLAGIRCGYCLGNKTLIDILYKVKGPYNLNTLTQKTAILALENRDTLLKSVKILNGEKAIVWDALKNLPLTKVYPSSANFIYFLTQNAQTLTNALMDNGILVRSYAKNDNEISAIRLTIGSPEENQKVLKIMKEHFSHE